MTEDKQGAPSARPPLIGSDRCPACGVSGLSMDRIGGACHALGCPDPTAWLRALSVYPPADNHPGGPLSRAERVVLSNLKGGAMRARALVGGMSHILGAIPGAQKIEAAHVEAVAAIDRLLMTMKLRKQGAPYPPGDAWGDASEGEPSDAVSAADSEAP